MRFAMFTVAILSIVTCVTAGEDTIKHDPPNHISSEESSVMIRGRVQIYGNEPHTFAGIVDENGTEYAVYPRSSEDELRPLQGYLIEFTVIMLDETQGYGGMFLGGGTVTPVSWEILTM